MFGGFVRADKCSALALPFARATCPSIESNRSRILEQKKDCSIALILHAWRAIKVGVTYLLGLGFQNVGCYKDTGNRAITPLEGSDPVLNGAYTTRHHAIAKCAVAAVKRGFTMFAVQHGGWCASSAGAPSTYNKYGGSGGCRADGEGGPWANQVYAIKRYKAVGCYRDSSNRAIRTLEGRDSILDGSYSSRKDAIAKCAVAAMRRGYNMFAVQHGGWCASSANAPNTYRKYGSSNACAGDGEGGPWANQVYLLTRC